MQIKLPIVTTRSPGIVYRLVLFDRNAITLTVLLFWVPFSLILDRYT
jgi:hypothetical protein